jgi:hypothetical protein
MWLYFLEKENEKVVILSNHLLLDMTRETQEELEKFNIRYTLTYMHIEDFEYAKHRWRRGGYEHVSVDWLAEVVKDWHCRIEEKPKAQPFQRYEDIFNQQKKRKPKRNIEEETEKKSPPKPPKQLPHQKWVWNKNHIIEGTIETIVEEALRRGLIFELIFSEFGREFAYYYGEAFKDLVRKKIREL